MLHLNLTSLALIQLQMYQYKHLANMSVHEGLQGGLLTDYWLVPLCCHDTHITFNVDFNCKQSATTTQNMAMSWWPTLH